MEREEKELLLKLLNKALLEVADEDMDFISEAIATVEEKL